MRAYQAVGIRVEMITGDRALAAATIAHQIGLREEDNAPVFTGD